MITFAPKGYRLACYTMGSGGPLSQRSGWLSLQAGWKDGKTAAKSVSHRQVAVRNRRARAHPFSLLRCLAPHWQIMISIFGCPCGRGLWSLFCCRCSWSPDGLPEVHVAGIDLVILHDATNSGQVSAFCTGSLSSANVALEAVHTSEVRGKTK